MTRILFLLLIALPLLASQPVFADDGTETVLINVNSDQGQVQGMAMELATKLVQADKEVRIVLCGDAAELALEENIPSSLRPRDVSPKEMMLEAVSLGATVQVCHLFLPNTRFGQYDEDDLVEDASVISAEELAELVTKSEIRRFSY
ncbi:hypothetical protein M0534_01955 [Methylonatrum kenyense]|uniref:hypothetical protein n=1 Tax=Methylonatrum kenyense TaxID=455253 RepID=UPI0020C0781E|nr:hypothetical protein [Methylonatrum kenyense]MCK8515097.1 hypothetical protein [Methylonatrum kenyense]